jgi:hypothetical protein
MGSTLTAFQKVTAATVGSVIESALEDDDAMEMSMAEMSVDSDATPLGKTPMEKSRNEGFAGMFAVPESEPTAEEEAKAATRIQCIHRGNKERQTMKAAEEAKAATEAKAAEEKAAAVAAAQAAPAAPPAHIPQLFGLRPSVGTWCLHRPSRTYRDRRQ